MSCVDVCILSMVIMTIWLRHLRKTCRLALRYDPNKTILVSPIKIITLGGKGCDIALSGAPEGIVLTECVWRGWPWSFLQITPINGTLRIDHQPKTSSPVRYHLRQLIRIRFCHRTYELRLVPVNQPSKFPVTTTSSGGQL